MNSGSGARHLDDYTDAELLQLWNGLLDGLRDCARMHVRGLESGALPMIAELRSDTQRLGRASLLLLLTMVATGRESVAITGSPPAPSGRSGAPKRTALDLLERDAEALTVIAAFGLPATPEAYQRTLSEMWDAGWQVGSDTARKEDAS